jgi:hypothetical protein
MLALWDSMAKKEGFDGLKFAFQSAMSYRSKGWDRSLFDYGIQFQPGFVNYKKSTFGSLNLMKYTHWLKKKLGIKRRLLQGKKGVSISDYDATWEKILSIKPSERNALPSAFVDWDNTPRKQERGSVYLGAHPDKFKQYFKRLIVKTREEYQQDKIFIFAWNEWAEGGYLEPDEKFGYAYLQAIKEALLEENEYR